MSDGGRHGSQGRDGGRFRFRPTRSQSHMSGQGMGFRPSTTPTSQATVTKPRASHCPTMEIHIVGCVWLRPEPILDVARWIIGVKIPFNNRICLWGEALNIVIPLPL